MERGRTQFSIKRFGFLTLFFLLSHSLFSEPFSLEQTNQGAPNIRAVSLPDSLHVQTEVTRLKKPKILWINWNLMREMGIELPQDPLEREKLILSTFAWGIPQNEKDTRKNFVEVEKNTYWADRYGGAGMGNALGSGRAAGAGNFQVKGIGITPLVDKDKFSKEKGKSFFKNSMEWLSNFSHSHGGVALTEGIREAEFGEILHQEMPFGANRVAFLIATGTSTKYAGVYPEARSLIVRENSLRPAHFMLNSKELEVDEEAEKERLKSYWPSLKKALNDLGMTEGDSSNKLRAGFLSYASRLGEVYGTLYARKIYRGAESPSNIELDGRMIDYGGLTLTPGYAQLMYADSYPNGDTTETESDVLKAFTDSLKKFVPKEERFSIPGNGDMRKVFKKNYDETLNREFLGLLGVPKEWVKELANTDSGRAVSLELQRLARLGNNKQIDSHTEIPAVQGKIDFRKTMPELVAELFSMHSNLPPKIFDNLLSRFPDLKKELNRLAQRDSIPSENLMRYMVLASGKRNETYSPLVRGMERTMGLMQAELMNKLRDKDYIENYISLMVEKGVRNSKEDNTYSIVVDRRVFPAEGTVLSRAYNAKTGQPEVWVDYQKGTAIPKFLLQDGRSFDFSEQGNLHRFILPDAPLKEYKFTARHERGDHEFVAVENPAAAKVRTIESNLAPPMKMTFKAAKATKDALTFCRKTFKKLTGF